MKDLLLATRVYMPHSTLRTPRYAVKEAFRISAVVAGGVLVVL